MDRPSLSSILSLAVLASSCGGTAVLPRAPLGNDEPAVSPSIGQRITSRSRDSLAYHVALADKRTITIELTDRFELVVRDASTANAKANIRRIDLAKADFDILDLVTNHDGSIAYVASTAGWVRGYELDSGRLLSEWRMGSSATALALSADAEKLVIGTATGVLCLRRLRDGAQLQCVAAHQSRVSAIAISGATLISGDWSGTVARWSLPSLREERRIAGTGFVSAIAWSPNSQTIAFARNARKPVRTPKLNAAEKESPQVDPPGHNVIELRPSSLEGTAVTLEAHRSIISALAWIGPDLVSSSWDRTVRIWNTTAPGRVRILLKLPHLGSDVATSRLGGGVAVASWGTESESTSITSLQLLYPQP